ncbi:uncharacterized protein [Musca autumnalis]|uniref:uncharacterized protein n=1 Tax=Musca autumnalis TaxID=221902 RepID=UPI003CF9B91A
MAEIRILLIFLFLNGALAADPLKCIGKYYFPEDETTFNILKRNISDIQYVNRAERPTESRIINTGRTIFMDFSYSSDNAPILTNGPFGEEKYQFKFIYFHWLPADISRMTNIFMEMHMIFINTRYSNYDEASKKHLGVVMIAVRHVNRGIMHSNGYYEYLKNFQKANEDLRLNATDTPTIFELAFSTKLYNLYVGKSTFPYDEVCSADVIWMEHSYVSNISPKEMQYFRDLKANDGKPLMSKTVVRSSPNSAIYKAVNVFVYEQKGFSVESFKGFDRSSVGTRCLKTFNIIIVLISLVFGINMI